MWSNLVTSKGQSNHFLFPAGGPSIFPYLDDFVEIKETNIPPWHQRYVLRGQQPSFLMMKRELRDLVQTGVRRLYVRYVRGGREYVFRQEEQPNILSQNEPYWVRKLVRVRDCYPNNLGICDW